MSRVSTLLGLRSFSRARIVASAVVLLVLSAIGFLPLFGGPGYEHSLASGLLVPAAAAVTVAIELSSSAGSAPLQCVARGMFVGAWLAAIALLTALLHGMRAGMCDFWGGTVFFLLTAGAGAVMGGLWGAIVAEACRVKQWGRGASVLLALAGPLAGIVVSVGRFYASPMIFAYDPFFGFFSGTLYDTIIDVRTELWTYRAGSLATVAGVALVASALGRSARGTLVLVGAAPIHMESARARRTYPTVLRLALGASALTASAVVTAAGPALGHWQTAASIAAALGGVVRGSRCAIVYPDSLLAQQASLLLRDCEQELAADEERLGVRLDGKLTAYVFRDADQKRSLMGAAQTSIAKPWRREVYIQVSGFPHPILGHEIAHVVSGTFGRGPFRIAGAADGLWPNPGLIEGVAVATSPDDDDLTDAQWARAMLDLGLLPPVERLFSLGFLGENASKSYTVAGAFVRWVKERWGIGLVRAWYGGASIEGLTSENWNALNEQFLRSLRELAMPPEASAYAKARFERPSVWARKCPHVVDALNRQADRCRDEHRFARATSLYEDALARDDGDWHARFDKARIDVWYGTTVGGKGPASQGWKELDAIASDERAPRTWRDRAREALADVDLANGREELAGAAYRSLAADVLDEDVARTLEVKALAARDPAARRAILDLLVGSPGRPIDAAMGPFSVGAWAAETREPLAQYLAGKTLALHDEYARAAERLDGVDHAAFGGRAVGVDHAAFGERAVGVDHAAFGERAVTFALSDRVARELLRVRAICACALRDDAGLERVEAIVDGASSPFAGASGGRREWLRAFVTRCRSR